MEALVVVVGVAYVLFMVLAAATAWQCLRGSRPLGVTAGPDVEVPSAGSGELGARVAIEPTTDVDEAADEPKGGHPTSGAELVLDWDGRNWAILRNAGSTPFECRGVANPEDFHAVGLPAVFSIGPGCAMHILLAPARRTIRTLDLNEGETGTHVRVPLGRRARHSA